MVIGSHQPVTRAMLEIVKRNFIVRKIFYGNLNEAISANEITSFRFPLNIFLESKLTILM